MLLSCEIFFGSTFAAWIGKFSRDVLTNVFGTFGESKKKKRESRVRTPA